MKDIELPPLPYPKYGHFPNGKDDTAYAAFSSDQMEGHYIKGYNAARAAIEADRAQRVPDGVDARLETWLTTGDGELHPRTKNLVVRFARAVASKLLAAEKKYGYSDGWTSPDWMDECRQKLAEHIAKGDPRDVAAYCAFLWHHGESTATPAPAQQEHGPSAEQVLEKVLSIVRGYLPSDGMLASAAMSEIIALVDPWPFGDPKGPK